jgi:hypothetical protein
MSAAKRHYRTSSAALSHLNELLDEALNETFPASDPIAIAVEFESAVGDFGIYNAITLRPAPRQPRSRERSS